MSQPYTFQTATNRRPGRTKHILFTVLALLAFAGGSLLLSLGWFGVGGGVAPGAEPEARAFLFIFLWPVTMLIVWICSIIATLLAKRWVLASFSLPAAIALLLVVWALVAFFMLNVSAVIFTAFFLVLNTGAIWLACWFLKSSSR
jgi:hypothetical protein